MRALARFLQGSKRPKSVVMKQQAKLFVRDVVKVTPPNKDWKYSPKGGQKTIRNDLAKIFRPSPKGIGSPSGVHKDHRGRDGRVRSRLKTATADNRIKVANLAGYLKTVLAKVGILASGWNAAAKGLGLTLPAWINRHGTKYGSVKFLNSATSGKIVITNGVRFSGDVKGLDRRVQWALDNRARQMDKQMDDYAVKKAAKRAGLTVK